MRTTGLSKKLGAGLVVNNLNLNIRRGDIYGFIGPNGAGKTTAMKVILGLLFPTSGSIELFGEPRNEKNLKRVGSLIEAPGLYTSISAYENMKQFSILSGGTDKDIWELLELVGLANVGKKRVGAFSLGMKQRLGIALALLGNPEIMILDEPVNGLDPMGMKAMRDIINNINKERGVTFFISSHLLGELEKISTVYGIINYGILTEEITAEELRKKCGYSIKIRCNNPRLAADIISKDFSEPSIIIHDDILDITMNPNLSANVNKLLVTNGIAVSEVGINALSYEDYFISRMNMVPPQINPPPNQQPQYNNNPPPPPPNYAPQYPSQPQNIDMNTYAPPQNQISNDETKRSGD